MKSSDVAYGAFELKRSYQVHLGWGITIGVLLHIAAVAVIAHLIRPDAIVVDPAVPESEGITVVFPLPRMERLEPPAANGFTPPIPAIEGIPVAALDEDIPFEYVPPVWEDILDGTTTTDPGGNVRMGHGGDPNVFGPKGEGSGDFPASGAFVAVEFQPVMIKKVAPEFPEMARLTGREGRVVVRALVDQAGIVRRAEIVRSSGTNVGFDEAAIEAALLCLYKPAIQNGHPVAIWVIYPV